VALSFRSGPAPVDSAPPRPTRSDESAGAVSTMTRLCSFAAKLRQHPTPEEMTQELLDDVLSLVGASEGALVCLADDEVEAVGFRSTASGLSPADIEFSRTMIARMLDAGEPVLVSDASLDPDLARAPSIQRSGTRSVMCAPIRDGNRILGALYVSSS